MDETYKEGNPLFENDNYREIENKQRKSRLSFAFGLTVVIFSIIGLIGCVSFVIGQINDKSEQNAEAEFARYNEFLLAVAAVDPLPFDDVTAADKGELVEIAVWSIIGSDLEPDKYDYSSGELAIPAADIEAAYQRYFGSQLPIVHQSVTGYGYEFSYSSEENCYYIPLTAIEPVYEPCVTETVSKGDTTTITLGLVNSSAFAQDAKTGKVSDAEPDKFIKVSLITSAGSSYISAIRTTALPETAIVEVFTTDKHEEISVEETSISETTSQAMQ